MILTTLALGALLAPQSVTDTSRPHHSFRFVYQADVPVVPSGAKQVRLWLPVPLDTPDQTITKLVISAQLVDSGDGGSSTASAAIMGKTPDDLKRDTTQGELTFTVRDIEGGFGRSVCIESPGKPIKAELAFDVTRYETKGGGKASPAELAALTDAEPLIPLDGKVAAVAASLKTPSEPLATARALYDHTLERMKYDKPESGGWGRGDAEWACDAKFGNCTDFHSYFMGLARSKGMPARFEMGFSVPPAAADGGEKEAKVGGYHCWAYVWIEGHGWMPVDVSEADKNPAKAEYFFGTLDADRVTMTGGRDLVLDPAPAAGALNFFVYPYAEIDGKPAEKVEKAFRRIDQ
jgi:transglutaminase-like putative cysteine protease